MVANVHRTFRMERVVNGTLRSAVCMFWQGQELSWCILELRIDGSTGWAILLLLG